MVPRRGDFFFFLRQPRQLMTTFDNIFSEPREESHLLSYVVYCCFCCRFLLSEPCEDTSWRLRLEIADSSLRNAPRSVSRASTSFRDDCRGGLSVFCCPLLSLVVYCCSCCRYLLTVPSPARNIFVHIRVIRGKISSFRAPRGTPFVVPCCFCCRFLLPVPSSARNPFV